MKRRLYLVDLVVIKDSGVPSRISDPDASGLKNGADRGDLPLVRV